MQAPKDSLGVWVRGQRFGIDGQWSYNSVPAGRDWCWSGPDGLSLFPLPVPACIEHVDPIGMSALIEEKQGWFLWQAAKNGSYRRFPTGPKRYHGSENFPPAAVTWGARSFELVDDEVQVATQGRVVARRRLARPPYTLAARPGQLAVSDGTAVYLLSAATLKTEAKLPIQGVRALAYDPSGKLLATLDGEGQIRVFQVSVGKLPKHPLNVGLWQGWNLTPAAFRKMRRRWERETGQNWWPS